MLHAHARAGLDPHLQADLDRAYWETDEPAEVIARRFEIELVQPGKGTQRIPASTRLAEHVTPIEAPGRCPRCSTGLVYRSRADRRDDHRSCVLCGHRDPVATCPCRACVAERDERAEERYRYWRRHLCRPEFAAFALDDLDRDASSLYWALCFLATHDDDPVSWEDARVVSGVRELDAPIERLVRAHLLFLHDGSFELNPHGPNAVRGARNEADALRPIAVAVQHGRASDDELTRLLAFAVPGFTDVVAQHDDRALEAALDDAATRHPELVTHAVREATRRYVSQRHAA